MIRILDLFIALMALAFLLPIILFCAFIIWINDGLPILFRQERVGLYGKTFQLIKFRSMSIAKKRHLDITVKNDSRITATGKYLRKWKLDEVPQLFNIINGDMSVVGPRPEVSRYVNMYPNEFGRLHSIRPGLTSFASIAFRNENDLLVEAANPEECYIKNILPSKIALDLPLAEKMTISTYFLIIRGTAKALFNK